MSELAYIRNFSIIAHIDHGKSTLADRFIQLCGGLTDREMEDQVLDSMDLERERGITIKAQSVALNFDSNDGHRYQLNLIDTPGHVDFSYEVSRSMAACEGALLVVDAVQGVEAQSVANCYTAIEQGLDVLPVLNKLDLPEADPDRVCTEIEEIIGLDASHAVLVSAKTGDGEKQLVAGIKNHYSAEELVGKKIIVVNNLAPAVLRGVESQGMLLAARDGDKVVLLTTEKDVGPGSKVQ